MMSPAIRRTAANTSGATIVTTCETTLRRSMLFT